MICQKKELPSIAVPPIAAEPHRNERAVHVDYNITCDSLRQVSEN
jgi:hypothetical protein